MRWLFGPLVLLGVWIVAELLSFGGLWLVDGSAFRPARLLEERAEVLSALPRSDSNSDRKREEGPPHVVHPFLGYVGHPERVASSGGLELRHNEFGLHDTSGTFHERGRDKVIIGITGGSVALRLGMLGTPDLSKSLQRSPRFAGKELVFVNFGEAGWKQPQPLMALNYLLALGAELDVLILLDGFNEVALHESENRAQGVFPAFPRKWLAWVRGMSDPAVARREGEIAYLRAERARWAAHFEGALAFSPLANLVWRARDRRLDAARYEARRWLDEYEPPEKPYHLTGPRRSYADDDALYDELVGIWRRSSEQMRDLARGKGIAYFHFLQPNQYVEGSKRFTAWELEYTYHEHHPYFRGARLGYPKLVAAGAELRRSGVAFRDLTPLFRDVSETVYSDPCCHLNEHGRALLARAIAETIVAADGAGAE